MVEPLVAFRLTLPERDEERATGLLWDAGTRGIEVRAGASPGFVELIAYFEGRAGLREALTAALADWPAAGLEPCPIPDVDWVARVREGFRPFSAGGFRIVPSWQAPSAPAADLLIVDPGRAFGTGSHETTRLCLAALSARAQHTRLGRVLDLGAGSGILAIAALRLGAERATAVDLDPEAVASAAQHARLNGLRLGLLCGDGGRPLVPGAFDTVVANVSAPLLCARPAEVLALPRPGGALLLSGFLVEDVPSVRDAYAAAALVRESREGEWAALEFSGAHP